MYLPAAFKEDRAEVLYEMIRTHPLGTLITSGAGGLIANLVPFLLDSSGGGTLLAHVARANDQVPALREGGETLVVFQGPQAYIAPSWYSSKAEHGKVVPTWNYVTVQVRGRPRIIEDKAWLRGLVERLTDTHEAGRQLPWKVADAPEDYVTGLLGAIVGIEIPIDAIDGKWKVSQNRPGKDRVGVKAGLAADGHAELAALITPPVDGQPEP